MNIAYKNATEAFEDLYAFIIGQGVNTNVGTKAVYNVGFYLLNPQQRVITTEWRKFSERYAERKYAWYMSGDRSVAEIKDRKSTRLNSSHIEESRMPSSA